MSMITLLRAEPRFRTDPAYTAQLLDKLMLAFGGSDFFFATGESVAFLLDLTLPADNAKGVNFDIRLTYGLLRLYRQLHGGPIPLYFRPAPGFTAAQVLQHSGYGALAALEDVTMTDLSTCPVVRRRCEPGLTGEEISVYQPLLQADVVVSLVKHKADQGRLFGSALHSLAAATPQELDEEHQDRLLVDLYSVVTPDLFLVDGTVGDGGFQPQTGDCLLGAADAVAADAVLAALSGIPVRRIDSLCLAAQYGLGVGDPGGIALYGDDLSTLMK